MQEAYTGPILASCLPELKGQLSSERGLKVNCSTTAEVLTPLCLGFRAVGAQLTHDSSRVSGAAVLDSYSSNGRNSQTKVLKVEVLIITAVSFRLF